MSSKILLSILLSINTRFVSLTKSKFSMGSPTNLFSFISLEQALFGKIEMPRFFLTSILIEATLSISRDKWKLLISSSIFANSLMKRVEVPLSRFLKIRFSFFKSLIVTTFLLARGLSKETTATKESVPSKIEENFLLVIFPSIIAKSI